MLLVGLGDWNPYISNSQLKFIRKLVEKVFSAAPRVLNNHHITEDSHQHAISMPRYHQPPRDMASHMPDRSYTSIVCSTMPDRTHTHCHYAASEYISRKENRDRFAFPTNAPIDRPGPVVAFRH